MQNHLYKVTCACAFLQIRKGDMPDMPGHTQAENRCLQTYIQYMLHTHTHERTHLHTNNTSEHTSTSGGASEYIMPMSAQRYLQTCRAAHKQMEKHNKHSKAKVSQKTLHLMTGSDALHTDY